LAVAPIGVKAKRGRDMGPVGGGVGLDVVEMQTPALLTAPAGVKRGSPRAPGTVAGPTPEPARTPFSRLGPRVNNLSRLHS
jgi:hypothetical protein